MDDDTNHDTPDDPTHHQPTEPVEHDPGDLRLQTMVKLFLDADVPAEVQMCPEPDSVAFRFGEAAHRRLDMHVGYDQLDRLAELVDDARAFRDAVTAELKAEAAEPEVEVEGQDEAGESDDAESAG